MIAAGMLTLITLAGKAIARMEDFTSTRTDGQEWPRGETVRICSEKLEQLNTAV